MKQAYSMTMKANVSHCSCQLTGIPHHVMAKNVFRYIMNLCASPLKNIDFTTLYYSTMDGSWVVYFDFSFFFHMMPQMLWMYAWQSSIHDSNPPQSIIAERASTIYSIWDALVALIGDKIRFHVRQEWNIPSYRHVRLHQWNVPC